MYLYATTVRGGQANPAKVIDWAVAMTQKINQISEVPTNLWVTTMSPGMGTMAFVSVVEELAEIEATETKLAVDSGYNALIDQALTLLDASSPVDQTLEQLVHGDPDAAQLDVRYAVSVRATLAPGAMVSGLELGVELAQRAKRITGHPTSFTAGLTGAYGQVSWVTLFESIEKLQAGSQALNADTEFAKVLDKKAAGAYLPGATQTITRKVI